MSDNKKLDLIASLQKNNQRQEEEKVFVFIFTIIAGRRRR